MSELAPPSPLSPDVKLLPLNVDEASAALMSAFDADPEAALAWISAVHPKRSGRAGVSEEAAADKEHPKTLDQALDLDAARLKLAAARGQGDAEYHRAITEVSTGVATTVASAIFYSLHSRVESGNRGNVPPSFAEAVHGQYADCYVLAWVNSRVLSHIGIDHEIAWVNGHAGVVLRHDHGGSANMFFVNTSYPREPYSQNLREPKREVVTARLTADVERDLAAHGRFAVFFHTQRFLTNGDSTEDRNAWLLAASKSGDERLRRDETLIMSVFPAESGRAVLAGHLAWKRALGKGDLQAAGEALLTIAGQYPELDARRERDYLDVCMVVAHYCDMRQYDAAGRIIEAYFSSFGISNDSRLPDRHAQLEALRAAYIYRELGAFALGATGQNEQSPDAERRAYLVALHRAAQDRICALEQEANDRHIKAPRRWVMPLGYDEHYVHMQQLLLRRTTTDPVRMGPRRQNT